MGDTERETGSLLSESSGRKQGWIEQNLASMSFPPWPLVALVGIVIVLLMLSSYTSSQMERTSVGSNIFLLCLPVLLIYLAHSMIKYGSFPVLSPSTKERLVLQPEGAASPWGVALFLGLMLVLLSYQSSFQSKWWPHWGSY